MYLILQARTDQSGWHELKCIYNATGLNYHDMAVVNYGANFVTQEHIYDYAKRAKGIIIGGLGESGYGEKDPVKRESMRRLRSKIIPVLKELINDDKPSILGICFGHQLLGEALGSKVEHAPDQAEVGTAKVRLTAEGRKDPLFKGISTEFYSVQAHNDAVMSLPENTVQLAGNKTCPIQAFRYNGSVYGVQFHPEMDNSELDYRLELYEQYTDKYSPATEKNAPEADVTKILKNFMDITRSKTSINGKKAGSAK